LHIFSRTLVVSVAVAAVTFGMAVAKPSEARADGAELFYPIALDYNWIGACETGGSPTEITVSFGLNPIGGGSPVLLFEDVSHTVGSFAQSLIGTNDPDFVAFKTAMESGQAESYFLRAAYAGCDFVRPLAAITLPLGAVVNEIELYLSPFGAGQTGINEYRVGLSDYSQALTFLFIAGTATDVQPDTDGDVFPDQAELDQAMDPFNPDSDADGISDTDELFSGTSPSQADTDGDGLSDGDEFGLNAFPAHADFDLDGLDDDEELNQYLSDPLNPDTDFDGLRDGLEVKHYGTNPAGDTDGDALGDGDEITLGSDPFDEDTDDDGLWDGMEHALGLDITDWDTDDDGLSDFEFLEYGTNAHAADTDFDGLSDGEEVLVIGSDPNRDDTDHDGLADGVEVALGLSPVSDDTDGDTASDGGDNCPLVPNIMQEDADEDGLGDACDPDADGDGDADATDNCPDLPNPSQLDTDDDFAGDACDLDDDGDGLTDATDSCALVAGAPFDADADGCRDHFEAFAELVNELPANEGARKHILKKADKAKHKLCVKAKPAKATTLLESLRDYVADHRGGKVPDGTADALDAYLASLIGRIAEGEDLCS
jgi:hypothetical protein